MNEIEFWCEPEYTSAAETDFMYVRLCGELTLSGRTKYASELLSRTTAHKNVFADLAVDSIKARLIGKFTTDELLQELLR